MRAAAKPGEGGSALILSSSLGLLQVSGESQRCIMPEWAPLEAEDKGCL